MISEQILNFSNLPNIQNYSKNGLEIETEKDEQYVYSILRKNKKQWMQWNRNTNKEIYEFYSHYSLARGHCICTGMGFLLRENWLLTKKEVEKITVIEIDKDLIEYHKIFNYDILNRIEVINEDIYEYNGKCDTLLLDNFEGGPESYVSFLNSVNKICNNIEHELAWMWPMESILDTHYRNFIGLNLSEIYSNIKKTFELKTFPDLNENQLLLFCYIFFCGNFSKCDFSKIQK
jgi:hypothetical protein